jgi:hypothetical protein
MEIVGQPDQLFHRQVGAQDKENQSRQTKRNVHHKALGRKETVHMDHSPQFLVFH